MTRQSAAWCVFSIIFRPMWTDRQGLMVVQPGCANLYPKYYSDRHPCAIPSCTIAQVPRQCESLSPLLRFVREEVSFLSWKSSVHEHDCPSAPGDVKACPHCSDSSVKRSVFCPGSHSSLKGHVILDVNCPPVAEKFPSPPGISQRSKNTKVDLDPAHRGPSKIENHLILPPLSGRLAPSVTVPVTVAQAHILPMSPCPSPGLASAVPVTPSSSNDSIGSSFLGRVFTARSFRA
jgi:hypothetical protein